MVQRSASLVEQLIAAITSAISSGEIIGDSGRLPSETELSERYSVSRATIREALSKLELAGLVVRRHGIGTFVNHIVKDQPGLIRGWLDEAPAFVNLIAQSGHTPSLRLLGATVIPAEGIAEHLGLVPGDLVVAIEKLFLAGAIPVIYSYTTVPCDFVQTQGEIELPGDSYQKPIYQLLKERSQRKVNHQNSEVRAVLADDRLATLLSCQPGAPLLQVEEIGYDLEQTPLFYALHHFRGDQVSFRQIRRPTFTVDPFQKSLG